MATSTVPVGKVEIKNREEKSVPLGWIVNSEGEDSTNPADLFKGGGLYPLGGPEDSAGYKGYGLGLLVEIFCAVLSGSNITAEVPVWNVYEKDGRANRANLGQCFIAIDPNKFGSHYSERINKLIQTMKLLPSVQANKPVLVPGEPETKEEILSHKIGIKLHENIIHVLQQVGPKFNVSPPNFNSNPLSIIAKL